MKANWSFLMGVVVFAAVSARAATVERVFRPERHSRGDTNVRVQQPIDEASWIWAKGSDVWGGAVFSKTRTTPETLAKMPQSFFKFHRPDLFFGNLGFWRDEIVVGHRRIEVVPFWEWSSRCGPLHCVV